MCPEPAEEVMFKLKTTEIFFQAACCSVSNCLGRQFFSFRAEK